MLQIASDPIAGGGCAEYHTSDADAASAKIEIQDSSRIRTRLLLSPTRSPPSHSSPHFLHNMIARLGVVGFRRKRSECPPDAAAGDYPPHDCRYCYIES